MATMNISLPEPLKSWVEDQAKSGRYANSSDYVRDLIRRDQERREKIAAMQTMVDESLASGISPNSIDDMMKEARRRAGVGHGL